MATPTLINLPPAPSDPATPSEMGPGTPNSGTTSLSALSTTAIKDGHKGAAPPHQHHNRSSSAASGVSTNTLDAERADRISRLAGMERLATSRQPAFNPNLPPHLQQGYSQHSPSSSYASSMAAQPSNTATPPSGSYTQGYFDPVTAQALAKERSTVGSASATGSAGGRTTWASGSDDVMDASSALDTDRMSARSSTPPLSDAGDTSLVGFGEAAGSRRATPMQGVVDSTTRRDEPMRGSDD